MAAPTSNAVAQLTLANGEPSTQGAKRKDWDRPKAVCLLCAAKGQKQT